jgi:phosphoglycerate dehydrogenase-like enzyme
MLADNLSGFEGLLLGIVGLGVIGVAVADLFHTMGCRICYYDPAPANRDAAAALGAKSMSLDELLRSADIVTLHVPLIPATQSLIGDPELAAMKQGAILIQASRGGVVDESALADHLQLGDIGGAAVDVYSSEPPAAENPLLVLSGEARHRLLLTPHVAGVTRQSAATLFRSAWQNLERVLIQKQPPLNRAY